MPLQAADITKYKALWEELGEMIDDEIDDFADRLLEAIQARIWDENGSADTCLDEISDVLVSIASDIASSVHKC